LGSLYFTLIITSTPYVIIGSTFGKIIVSCLVTSTSSTPLNILMPWTTAFYSTM
jgi:hypothetical protein